MKKGDYRISDIYQGGYSTLMPTSNYFQTGKFGMTTDPRNANILQEVSSKLSSGVKNIEIEAVSPEFLDSVPKQALKEVNRLSKLTGIDVSLHGPVMDVSGISQNGYSETDRETSERKIIEVLKRAKELNPDGNVPVNFHSAEGIPGSQLLPPSERKKDEQYKRMIVVNRENGKMTALESDFQYMPGGAEIKIEKLIPEDRVRMLNKTEWDNQLSQLLFQKERADEILEKNRPFIEHLIDEIEKGKISEGDLGNLSHEQLRAFQHYRNARVYLDDLHKQANSFFSKAYEFAGENQKQKLKEISEHFGKVVSQAVSEKSPLPNPFVESQAFQELLHNLRAPEITPEMYVPIEKFAVEKSAQTFGNAAYKTYKELKGKNVPLLVIENPPAGFALSTGEDIKNIVEKSREQFVKKAVEEGMSESQAKKEAEKLIGATLDVGHMNMLRKQGYAEKDIVKEAEKVAPFVKHVHLSDNFGFEHTELPMGMGNVPLKEMMEKLGEKGFDARKIIEAAHWWQHFKTPPFQETLEAVGSPLYSMKMAPYWNQAPGLYQGYFSGYGSMLPQTNYETFGAGFSRLPSELGGSVQGTQGSRMSGKQME